MDNSSIHINTVRWELETFGMQTAADWQDKASHFSQYSLPVLVEQSFAPYNKTSRTIIIEQLELDLDQVSDEMELAEKIQWSLQKAIIEEMSRIRAEDLQVDPASAIAKKGQWLDNLVSYLLTGKLSWHANREFMDEPGIIYERLSGSGESTIKDLLERITGSADAIKRFIQLFNEAQLFELLERAGYGTSPLKRFINAISEFFKLHLTSWPDHPFREFIFFFTWIKQRPTQAGNKVQPAFIEAWKEDLFREHFITGPGSIELKEKLEKDVFISEIITTREAVSSNNEASRIRRNEMEELENKEIDKEQSTQDDETSRYFIQNAGILLFYPFLKNWFRDQGFLDQDNAFRSLEARMQACQFMQAIAMGHADFPEYHLVLNKVVCGYPLDAPVYGYFDNIYKEKPGTEKFIRKLMGKWKKLGKVSVEGFRGSFIQRFARLTEEEDHFHLKVERKGWDVLLGELSYPISVINLPWMQKPLYTSW